MKRMREERTMCYLVKNTQGDKILMRQVHFCPRESNRDYIHPATCCKHKTDNIYEMMMYKTLDIKEEGTVIPRKEETNQVSPRLSQFSDWRVYPDYRSGGRTQSEPDGFAESRWS